MNSNDGLKNDLVKHGSTEDEKHYLLTKDCLVSDFSSPSAFKTA